MFMLAGVSQHAVAGGRVWEGEGSDAMLWYARRRGAERRVAAMGGEGYGRGRSAEVKLVVHSRAVVM
jgi:hypothetical protein